MSTQVDFDIDLEIGLMEWEMPATPCESTDHDPGDMVAHDDGPATHYARMHCVNGCGLQVVKAYCAQFINYLLADRWVRCTCGREATGLEIATILGPIKP